MPKLAVIATIDVAYGRIEEYLPLLLARRERCLRDEPGTLAFEVLRPREDGSAPTLYEVCRDETALEAHWNAPSLARHRQEAGDMIVKMSGRRFTPVT